MKRFRNIWILVLAAWLGCADGGPVGTGIASSSVSGTVTQADTSTGASPNLETPVRVSIDEVPGVEDTTDAEGNFDLVGDFSGELTLRFTAPDTTATTPIDVPLGSETDLGDVQLQVGAVMLTSRPRLRNFVGVIVFAECSDAVSDAADFIVNDRKAAANQFMVRVSSETIIVRGDGQDVGCTQVKVADSVAIEGVIRPDRTVEAITIIIAPRAPGGPQPIEERSFRGTVSPVINCETGNILIDDEMTGVSRLRLVNTTVIKTADRNPLQCQDIAAGDLVEGRGLIRADKPEEIRVDTLVVTRPLESAK